uniref:Rho-GAP domain-containing protein n=1 Tax=Rhabditophanes sp. KR3021 TaxID=114890 RepID=A0AC35U432_9BILA
MERLKENMNSGVRKIRTLTGSQQQISSNLGKPGPIPDKKEILLTNSMLDVHNQRICASLKSIRGAMINTLKSNLKEDNTEKKKKKLDLHQLAGQFFTEHIVMKAHSPGLEVTFEKAASVYKDIVEYQTKMESSINDKVLERMALNIDMEKDVIKFQSELKKAGSVKDSLDKKLRSLNDESKQSDLQSEYDLAVNKMDSSREITLTHMYALKGLEYENAMLIKSYMQHHLDFHRMSANSLEKGIENIEKAINKYIQKPSFGVDLKEHCDRDKRQIAAPIQICVEMLTYIGFDEQGLFRVPGNQHKVKRLRAALDCGAEREVEEFVNDPHTICAVLKQYLRELPNKLFPSDLMDGYIRVAEIPQNTDEQANFIKYLLDEMPKVNRDNISYLMKFLSVLTSHEKIVNMNASNLALVLSPNLFNDSNLSNGFTPSAGARFCELLITYADRYFDSYEWDFTRRRVTNTKPGGQHDELSITSMRDIYDANSRLPSSNFSNDRFQNQYASSRETKNNRKQNRTHDENEFVQMKNSHGSIRSLVVDDPSPPSPVAMTRSQTEKPSRPTIPPPKHYKNSSSDSDKITFTGVEQINPQMSQSYTAPRKEMVRNNNSDDSYENYAVDYPQSPTLSRKANTSPSYSLSDKTTTKMFTIREMPVDVPTSALVNNTATIPRASNSSFGDTPSLYPNISSISTYIDGPATDRRDPPYPSPRPRKAPSPPRPSIPEKPKKLNEVTVTKL